MYDSLDGMEPEEADYYDDLDIDDSDLLEAANSVDRAAGANQHSAQRQHQQQQNLSTGSAAPYSPPEADVPTEIELDEDEYPFPELDEVDEYPLSELDHGYPLELNYEYPSELDEDGMDGEDEYPFPELDSEADILIREHSPAPSQQPAPSAPAAPIPHTARSLLQPFMHSPAPSEQPPPSAPAAPIPHTPRPLLPPFMRPPLPPTRGTPLTHTGPTTPTTPSTPPTPSTPTTPLTSTTSTPSSTTPTPISTLAHYTRRFPTPVRPRSAVDGLSARVVIRTIFRLSQLPSPPPSPSAPLPSLPHPQQPHPQQHQQHQQPDILIELYARVASVRLVGGGREVFVFTDLFTNDGMDARAVVGVYEGVGRCELWDTDAEVFLGAERGAIARVVGRVRRGGDAAGNVAGVGVESVYVKVLVVWEVDANEVAVVRALVGV